MITGTSITLSNELHLVPSTIFIRIFNSLPVVAVIDVDQIVSCPPVVVSSRSAVHVRHKDVPLDETCKLSCSTVSSLKSKLMVETDNVFSYGSTLDPAAVPSLENLARLLSSSPD